MGIVLAILALAATVCLACFARYGGMVFLALVVLIAGCCFGHPFAHANLGPIPLTSDRVGVALLVMLYGIGRIKGMGVEPKVVGRADLLLLILIGVFAVSMSTHAWTIDRMQPLSRLLFLWVMPALYYWVVRQSKLTERNLNWVQLTLVILGVYLSVTAFAETQFWSWLIYPKYIASAVYSEFLGRGRGPFLNPIGNGMFLTAGLAATLLYWPSCGVRGRLLISILAVTFAIGISCTYTRSVWIGAAVTAAFIGLQLVPGRMRPSAIGIALIIAVSLVATRWEDLLAFKRDKGADAAITLDSVKLRPILAYVAWQMFEDRPLWGCGFGQYSAVVRDYIYDRSTPLNLSRASGFVPHNVFLGILAETGLLGLVPFQLFIAMCLRDAFRVWRTARIPRAARRHAALTIAIVGTYLLNGMFHDVSVIAMSNMLLLFLCGLSSGIAAKHLPDRRTYDRRSMSNDRTQSSRDHLPVPALSISE